MRWLNQNGVAIQALATVVIAVLTVALFWATKQYVAINRGILRVSQMALSPDLAISLNKQIKDHVAGGTLKLEARGKNPARLQNVALDAYCSHSACTQMAPINFEFLTWRVLQAGDRIEEQFQLPLKGEHVFHEAHEGECDWILCVRVQCTDLLYLFNHDYNFDEVLLLSHSMEPATMQEGRWRKKARALKNAWSLHGFRARSWWRAKRKRTA